MNGNTTTSNFQNRLRKAMRADPKKSVTLAALCAVLLVLVLRMVVGQGGHPSSAGAAMLDNSKDNSSLKTAHPGTAWQRSIGSAASLAKWNSAPLQPLSRNLFAVRIEYFSTDSSRTTQTGLRDAGFWAELEKSMSIQADQRDKQENLKANFKSEAEKLKLTSTLTGGSQPKAMVDGKIVGEGDVVASFRVLKIEDRRITVEREGIKLEIQTK